MDFACIGLLTCTSLWLSAHIDINSFIQIFRQTPFYIYIIVIVYLSADTYVYIYNYIDVSRHCIVVCVLSCGGMMFVPPIGSVASLSFGIRLLIVDGQRGVAVGRSCPFRFLCVYHRVIDRCMLFLLFLYCLFQDGALDFLVDFVCGHRWPMPLFREDLLF